MRKLNDMFHIDGDELVKTSNGKAVPHDEPLFILRARDQFALPVLALYCKLSAEDNCDPGRIKQLGDVVGEFGDFQEEHPERMKQPGCTKGA